MNVIVWKDYFDNLGRALDRLEEALKTKHDEQHAVFIRDSTIQRFEFVIELYWKTLKKFLEYEQVGSALTPRDIFAKSFQFGLIDDEDIWLTMIKDRNNTSHEYKEEEAKRIFDNIKKYYPVMRATYERLQKRFEGYEKEDK